MSHLDRTRGGEPDEVDRLVDVGLERYGAGDIDGALRAWEHALVLDPDEVRASAYVDYVREHYELLAGGPGLAELEMPYGLGAVPGDGASSSDDDDYEVEITPGTSTPDEVRVPSTPPVQYVEAVEEGWVLGEEAAPAAERAQRPSQPPASRVQLPLPADEALEVEDDAVELETEAPAAPVPVLEPIELPPIELGPDPGDDERTNEFSDLRSAAPTQEINAPRGFVRPRAESNGFDAEDDRLRTRPGRSAGSPLDLREIPQGLAAEAIGALSPANPARPPHGPPIGSEDNTRESPLMRVTFEGDDDKTGERAAVRRELTPEPLDGPVGRTPSDRHPPLVIVEGEHGAHEFGAPGSSQEPTAETRPRRTRPAESARTLDGIGPPMTPPVMRTRRSSASPVGALPTAAMTPAEELAVQLLAALDAEATSGEARADRTRRRVSALIDRSVAASEAGDHPTAIVALDLALSEEPDTAVAQKLIHRHQPVILDVYQRYLGNLANRPGLAMPMHELSGEKLDIRAAFLLSRIDGTLTFEEILDVSGMQRAEAYRHLANLVLRGILTVG